MKFNCGPTWKERRDAWQAELEAQAQALQQWHKVFALLPKRVASGDCRWLEYVWRRYPTAWAGWGLESGLALRKGSPLYRAVEAAE